MTKLNRTVINHLHSLNSPFLPLVDLFTGLLTYAGDSSLFRFQTIPVFLMPHWCYSTVNDEQAPSYPQDQTAWASDFSQRPLLQLLPKLYHVNPIKLVRQGSSTLWVSIAAFCNAALDCKAPSRVSNGFAMLLKVPPTWSLHVSQTGCALKLPISILVKAVWMSRRGSVWFCCEKWQYT